MVPSQAERERWVQASGRSLCSAGCDLLQAAAVSQSIGLRGSSDERGAAADSSASGRAAGGGPPTLATPRHAPGICHIDLEDTALVQLLAMGGNPAEQQGQGRRRLGAGQQSPHRERWFERQAAGGGGGAARTRRRPGPSSCPADRVTRTYWRLGGAQGAGRGSSGAGAGRGGSEWPAGAGAAAAAPRASQGGPERPPAQLQRPSSPTSRCCRCEALQRT